MTTNRARTKSKTLRSSGTTAEERNAKSTKTPPKNSKQSAGHKREVLSEEELKKSGLHLKKTSWNAIAPMWQVPHVLEPLAQEEVHEQSKIITNDKKKTKREREREKKRERERIIKRTSLIINNHREDQHEF